MRVPVRYLKSKKTLSSALYSAWMDGNTISRGKIEEMFGRSRQTARAYEKAVSVKVEQSFIEATIEHAQDIHERAFEGDEEYVKLSNTLQRGWYETKRGKRMPLRDREGNSLEAKAKSAGAVVKAQGPNTYRANDSIKPVTDGQQCTKAKETRQAHYRRHKHDNTPKPPKEGASNGRGQCRLPAVASIAEAKVRGLMEYGNRFLLRLRSKGNVHNYAVIYA